MEKKPKVKLLNLCHIKRAQNYDAKNLEAILIELEETRELCLKYEDIIEHAPDGIYITDGEANAILINPAFGRISGLDITKMLGRNHSDLIKDKIIVSSSALMVVEQRKPVTIIHEYIPSNRTALVSSNPVFNENGDISIIVSNTRDVTELLELRTKLEQQRQKTVEYERQLEVMKKQFVNTDDLIIEDKLMFFTISLANRVTQVDSTVLLTGETGVGKEEVAKYIHSQCPRRDHPFIVVNCGAIPANLVESELFGYESGSFTGARKEGKLGLLEAANGGTLFLDEVGELPLDTQVKLLRALQERKIQRVGGVQQIPVDVRIISATNRDLKKMVKEKTFREDLYYRLCIVPIHIPALRERPDDIIPLINHFLKTDNQKYSKNKTLSGMAYQVLLNHLWPGNVRELRSMIERVVVMTDHDVITAEDMPEQNGSISKIMQNIPDDMPLKERMEKMEYEYILEAYEKHNSVRKAASSLGMSVGTYTRKKNDYAIKFAK